MKTFAVDIVSNKFLMMTPNFDEQTQPIAFEFYHSFNFKIKIAIIKAFNTEDNIDSVGPVPRKNKRSKKTSSAAAKRSKISLAIFEISNPFSALQVDITFAEFLNHPITTKPVIQKLTNNQTSLQE
ncbi:hypothetical protein CEXT_367801 [Caerostris extrusa]|uniref:Uncharacterized protein n=1 Tax=Caerostris extrusa TaxID=172846 RepID=A0AAV4QMY5_CAEEX|nr:hypothetical protein CEXT_367801 [Caerostris extrusa]